MTVAPGRTRAWLPMHRLHPGISTRPPTWANTLSPPSRWMASRSMRVAGAIHNRLTA